jgi:hypothetical protein
MTDRRGPGRPKGSPNELRRDARANYGPNLSPLDYLLAVMRDEAADPRRRDAMAVLAARYVHPRRGRGGR